MTASELLQPFHLAVIGADDFKVRWAHDVIAYYVMTGRAYKEWEQALMRSNPTKLLAYMAASQDSSHLGMMEACNRYLKRYCKLKDKASGL